MVEQILLSPKVNRSTIVSNKLASIITRVMKFVSSEDTAFSSLDKQKCPHKKKNKAMAFSPLGGPDRPRKDKNVTGLLLANVPKHEQLHRSFLNALPRIPEYLP